MQDSSTSQEAVTIEMPAEIPNQLLDATGIVQPEPPQELSTNNPQPIEPQKEEISTNIACSCPIDKPCEHFPDRKPIAIMKHAGGRPCEFCSKPDEVMKIVDAYLERTSKAIAGKIAMPWLEELSMDLDIDEDTMSLWAKKKLKDTDELEHPQFFRAYIKLKTLQRLRLKQKLMGRYNPSGSIFLLKANHGLMETEKQIHAGDANEPLEIIITEAKTHAETD